MAEEKRVVLKVDVTIEQLGDINKATIDLVDVETGEIQFSEVRVSGGFVHELIDEINAEVAEILERQENEQE